ncbi:tryptophan 2,3-dioxygenase [Crocinitomicaceae bacterium CZZ-1]|uniref:Tryptophan 2,3-dioxygenase n=1 Tax=Taishania pollutisoli TaxID=2766479 RepID=A0A8J6U200_9FLAO|nr:tryptophan 2,3-dioxygenase family protein [Taishania pollutisoli]MBC9811830.1 tryptophan 2,3-dioxygenase [Taishania pollutisoli]MBX2948230.1 tryptophan 2,3-dioxygenase [Crocinitomicaceae bacterium]NGF75333.1 tryptophan 2,3-dioxygenase [Fluviicola sp. SGL-29]
MLSREELLKLIDEKYQAMRENPDIYLSGLLHSKPLTYWDYIQVDALLGLQIQRTTEPDEMVFIMYHQINELLFKMILWEIGQVSHCEEITPKKFSMHLGRISRYFDMLSNSFNIMQSGMEIEQYMKYRDTLTPASGFQSAQFRKVEFASTDLLNLIDFRVRPTIDRNTPYEHAFDNMYWQAAGLNPKTGKKSALLSNFEKKYKKEFIDFMQEYNTINLLAKYKSLPEEDRNNLELVNAMRHYDYTVNISWVMNHFNAARHYIESGKGSGEATGGSDWKKYMLPQYQKRIFFPELWTDSELDNWGIDNLEGYKTITDISELTTNKQFKGWQK